MNMFSKQDLEAFGRTYAEQGYLIFKDVVPKEQLSELKANIFREFERSKQSGKLFEGGGQISGHLNCFPGEGSRFALTALEERGVLDVMRQLYDKPAALRV